MAGVRGFSDPNVQVNSGDTPVWEQAIDPSIKDANFLLPWYLNYQGGSFLNATQCMYDSSISLVAPPLVPFFFYFPTENSLRYRVAGDNGWQDNHAALNGGLNNHWATNNTPWSWGHFQRGDIPVQFAIAEGWTVGDMYQVGDFRSAGQHVPSVYLNLRVAIHGSFALFCRASTIGRFI